MERKIIWNKSPSKYLAKALKKISEDSIFQAERIEEEIISAVNNIPKYPERYPPDKFKKNNDGHYRAFQIFSFRVSYKLTKNEIRILRVRHVKQEPKEY